MSRQYSAALRSVSGDAPLSQDEWEAAPRSPEGVPVLSNQAADWMAQIGPDASAPLDQLSYPRLCHLARYVPSLLASGSPMRRALAELVARHKPERVERAVDMGCGVGADLRMLREHAPEVIGLDCFLVPLRVAKQQLDGEQIGILERVEGHRFRWSDEVVALPALDGVELICGNAQDAPLASGCADIVLAANLIDNVPMPRLLLGELDRILRPGGLVVLSSPFNWQDEITPPSEQLGGVDSAGSEALVAEALTRRGYVVLETRDVPWTIVDHLRCEYRYRVHTLAARKSYSP